jgi:ubiquinone/menaquinone biosynthesis C-methylase UbiE
MKINSLEFLRCPLSGEKLTIDEGAVLDGDEIITGSLVSTSSHYRVDAGFPYFAADQSLTGDAIFARQYYASIADTYDENVHVTFDLFNEEELEVRQEMISMLHLQPSSKVLEVSAGTGKDSELIIQRLGNGGELWLLDISPAMLAKAQQRLGRGTLNVEFIVGNACLLPFGANYFDALYCFAGVGHFPDLRAGLSEMARVVRPGGRVVFCEKNVPPWLRNTEYGKILINNNPMFADTAPLSLIPVEARKVGVRWTLGNAHYVIDYTVGEGEPSGNFDLEMPGYRGGSFNTRYFGKLEGVTPEAKSLYQQAAKRKGVSLHTWLDDAVKNAALLDLKERD